MPADIAALRPPLESILDRAIAARAFPGAVARLQWREQVLEVARGHLGYEAPFLEPVASQTVYDLASLSKLWTLSAALFSLRARHLDPNTPLHFLLPEFDTPDKRAISLRHLLMHASGISLAIQSLAPAPRQEWIERIARAPLACAPGERVLYSCTNYFLLARALDMDAPDGFLRALIEDGRTIHAPDSSLTLHPRGLPAKWIAPTEADPQTQRALRGEVHDEAARFWSSGACFSFAGNSGLFGDAAAVAGLARLWLGEGAFFPGDAERALSDTLPEAEGEASTRRGWGWQIDAALFCGVAGLDAPRGAFGHAGFTGPTLWAHRPTQSVCVLLNNRVHPTRDGPSRFPFHREVSRAFGRFLARNDPEYFQSPV